MKFYSHLNASFHVRELWVAAQLTVRIFSRKHSNRCRHITSSCTNIHNNKLSPPCQNNILELRNFPTLEIFSKRLIQKLIFRQWSPNAIGHYYFTQRWFQKNILQSNEIEDRFSWKLARVSLTYLVNCWKSPRLACRQVFALVTNEAVFTMWILYYRSDGDLINFVFYLTDVSNQINVENVELTTTTLKTEPMKDFIDIFTRSLISLPTDEWSRQTTERGVIFRGGGFGSRAQSENTVLPCSSLPNLSRVGVQRVL